METTGKLSARVAGLPVAVKVTLGETRLPLESVAQLQRGVTVLLDTRLTDPARGLVGEAEVFSGTVYTQFGRFAVRLDRILRSSVEGLDVSEPTE
jgi:flagellar motor switch protein FliM